MHYLYRENKGDDQLHGYREADLRLCFRICKNPFFSQRGSYVKPDHHLCFPRHEKTCCLHIMIFKNKDADQLHGSHEADQQLCFRYIESKIFLLSKSEISSLYPSKLCQTWSETQKTGFLVTRLACISPANEPRHEKPAFGK